MAGPSRRLGWHVLGDGDAMNLTMGGPGIVTKRYGTLVVYAGPEVSPDVVKTALDKPGSLLKESPKAITRRVDDWVIKQNAPGLKETVKYLLRPGKYRQGWIVARYLEEHGIGVPHPAAYVERMAWGVPVGYAFVSAYLEGYVNVEDFARSLVSQSATGYEIEVFLRNLAGAVATLDGARAYHSDLSGKNIFTSDAKSFVFIDLDAVTLDTDLSDEQRLLNHVQLYDSFCDLWDDGILQTFVEALWQGATAPPGWFDRVKAGQSARRARTEALWRKQGRLAE